MTTPSEELRWIPELLRVFAFDDTEDLWWRDDNGVLSFYVRCSDTYWWATADLEDVGPEDLAALRQAKADLASDKDHSFLWPTLWVSRKRSLRPMRAWYRALGLENSQAQVLFDACGPERDPASEG